MHIDFALEFAQPPKTTVATVVGILSQTAKNVDRLWECARIALIFVNGDWAGCGGECCLKRFVCILQLFVCIMRIGATNEDFMHDTRELPKHFDFSHDGYEWVCFQANTRKPLTMEYRKITCPELPYFAVERQEYFRFCRVHIEDVVGIDGEREYSKDEIVETVNEFFDPNKAEHTTFIRQRLALESMAKEILRLREAVVELQRVIDDE